MGQIELEGMYFYAYHGHFESEQIVGNEFLVDLSIETDCSKPAETDKLKDALNYQEVYETVKFEMKINSSLLENVAGRILNSLYNKFPEINKARVKVSKLNPPMGGQIKKVSISLSK